MTNPIRSGDFAPLFDAVDHNGNSVLLENYRGRKVLLAFFRFSACALCNLRVHQFISRYPTWRDNRLDIIAIFESSLSNLQIHAGKQNPPFSLIADPTATIYNKYAVETSEEKVLKTMSNSTTVNMLKAEVEQAGFQLTHEEGSNFHRIPAEFLIDEQGVVQVAHYNRFINDHLSFDTIDHFVF